MSSNSPIAILDSGLGGLTVVRALRDRLPHERIVYFGDTARLPYGSKTAATVTTFTQQIVTYLRQFNPKHVVIACNTATALALPAVRAMFPDLSISGVIEPGAKAAAIAAGANPFPIIGVIATEATIRSKAYSHAIARRRHHARILFQATPLLVPMIEEGRSPDDPLVRLALTQYLTPMINHRINVLVLGCTHYPALVEPIRQIAGPAVRVIDSAQQCADDVARRLLAAGLLAPGARVENGDARYFVTDDPARFARLAKRFLDADIEAPTLVAPEILYEIPPTAPLPFRHAG